MNRLLFLLLVAVGLLLLLGVVMLDSATVAQAVPHRFYSHLLWLGLGACCGAGVATMDYRRLRAWRIPTILLIVCGSALVAVFIPGAGVLVNGARRWFSFGGQPSELAKLALILWLAEYGAAHQARMSDTKMGLLIPGGVCGVVACLIFIEPDWGTAVLVAAVSWSMLLMAGARAKYLTALLALALPVFVLLVLSNPVRFARILSFLDPEGDQAGIGWQAWHSVLSIGQGGLTGAFFGGGSHKYGFVPEQQTDFIFSLIGEELGLAGSTFVVLLFAMIVYCGSRMAWRMTDPFGQLLSGGVSLLIGLQAAINIGVCTSSIPNKGIPLPFVSYGGSSLICMLMMAGLLVSVARHAPQAPVYPSLRSFPDKPNPFGLSPMRPHSAASIQVASVLLHRKPTVWGRGIAWINQIRHRRTVPGLHPYQRLPVVKG